VNLIHLYILELLDATIKINNKKLFLEFIKKSVREEPGNEKAWVFLIKYYLKNNNFRQAKY
jgi:cytochrome c-type biogenesis protein CcmH/NrfG